MRRLPAHYLLLTVLSAGLLASCKENAAPTASTSGQNGMRRVIPSNLTGESAPLQGGAGTAAAQGSTRVYNPTDPTAQAPAGGRPRLDGAPVKSDPGTPAINAADLPEAPANAQWTLYCQSISGPGHVERANDVKQQLIRSTGMKSWYVIHTGEASNLYYGFYRTIDSSERSDSRKDGQQAQKDRQRIDAMKDSAGERPFARCMFVELAAPDPQAPTDWNLLNTPDNMYWSVQIAAYQHHPDRKKYAVDAVRDARARGVPAYFYHGPSVSSVCVGTWPMSAVRYDLSRGRASDPTRAIAVMPEGLKLPPLEGKPLDKDGRPVDVATDGVEIVDPSLIATLQKYPRHAINGAERVMKGKDRNQKPIERPEASFMVRIPNRFVAGENVGDAVNPDTAQVPDTGYSWLRPRERSRLDYIPKNK
jgi:hypothetical protein